MHDGPTGTATVRDEASLVERAQRGDRVAFDTLVDGRVEATFREVLAILGDEAAAVDTTRTAFVRAWRELPGFRRPAAFTTWFGRIVVETCRPSGRGKTPSRRPEKLPDGQRVREIQVGAIKSDDGQPTRTPVDGPGDWGDPDLVVRALGRLPVAARTLLYLHYRAHLSPDEIGLRLGVRARLAWSRLFDARQALERELTAELAGDPGGPLTDEAIATAFGRRAGRPCPRGLRLEVSAETGSTRQVRRRGQGSLARLRSPVAIRLGTAGLAIVGLIALVGLGLRQVPQPVLPSAAPVAQAGLLAFIRDDDVYLSQPDGSEPVRALHADGVPFRSIAWSPNGRQLAVGSDEAVFMLDPVDLAVRRLATGQLAAWSPDGDRVAIIDPAAAQDDGSGAIKLIRVTDGYQTNVLRMSPQTYLQTPLAWSPDGRWLVGQGRSHLLRIDVESGLAAEIAAVNSDDSPSAGGSWSPDSRHIAYIAPSAPAPGESCRGNCTGTLTVIDADGGAPTQPVSDMPSQSQPVWSPDGRSIAFLAGDRNSGDGAGLAIVDLGQRQSRMLATGLIDTLAWSPSGRSLGFERRSDTGLETTWTVGQVSAIGGPERSTADGSEQVLVPARPEQGFGWQPVTVPGPEAHVPTPNGSLPPTTDPEPQRTPGTAGPVDASRSGSALVFDISADDPAGGFCTKAVRVTSVGGKMTIVRSFCGRNFNTGLWSPDGSTYAALVDDRLELARVNGSRTTVAAGFGAVDQLAWSPDGRWLVAHRCPNGPGCVWQTVRPDGTRGEELTGEPVWSADGKHRMVRLNDGTTLLTDGDGLVSTVLPRSVPVGATLAPDGSAIAYVQDGDAWVEAFTNGPPRKVTDFAFGGALDAIWSPDGRSLAVPRSGELWIVPVSTGLPRQVLIDHPAGVGTSHWSPDGRYLAVEVWPYQSARSHVQIVSIDRSPSVVLNDAHSPVWSPDGRFLAFARTDVDGGAIALDVARADGDGRTTVWTSVWTGTGNNLPQAWVH